MGDIDQAFELIENYLCQLDIGKAEQVIFCADGARSYWKRFGPLAKKLKLMGHFEVKGGSICCGTVNCMRSIDR
jgi:hypothetical protein